MSQDDKRALVTTDEGLVRVIKLQDQGGPLLIGKIQEAGTAADSSPGALFGYQDTDILYIDHEGMRIVSTRRAGAQGQSLEDEQLGSVCTFAVRLLLLQIIGHLVNAEYFPRPSVVGLV